jgi:hypothetical protein
LMNFQRGAGRVDSDRNVAAPVGRRLLSELGAVVGGDGFVPGEEGGGEAFDGVGVFVGEVGGFAGVFEEIEEAGVGAVVVAEEFPLLVTDGEVRVLLGICFWGGAPLRGSERGERGLLWSFGGEYRIGTVPL